IRLMSLFPQPSTDPFSFSAPSVASDVTMRYAAAVADGRGGSAEGGTQGTGLHDPASRQPPTCPHTGGPVTGPVGTTVTVNVSITDPDGTLVTWDLREGHHNGTSGICCYAGSSATRTFNDAGVYRVAVQGIDQELNVSENYSTVVRIGGA